MGEEADNFTGDTSLGEERPAVQRSQSQGQYSVASLPTSEERHPRASGRMGQKLYHPAFGVVGGRRPQLGPQVESIKRSAPTVGFGSAPRFDAKNTQFISKKHSAGQVPIWTPGPGQYPKGGAMGDQAESHKRSLGQYSFASTARFGDLDPERKPGPGAYKMRDSVVLSTKVKAGTAPFGYSERENRVCYKGMEEAFFCREGRGPGSYRVYSGMGRQVDSKTTHMGYSFGRSMRATDSKAKNPDEKRAANMPGPGDYFSYATAGKEKPAYSFTRAPAREGDESGLAALMRAEEAKRKPTELTVPQSLGRQLLSTKATKPSWRFAMGTRFAGQGRDAVPGPGAYVV